MPTVKPYHNETATSFVYSHWKRSSLRCVAALALVSTVSVGGFASPASAAIIISGGTTTPSYNGDDPWNIQGNLTVGGFSFPGGSPSSLLVNDGSVINDISGFVGGSSYYASAEVTVIGTASQWNNSEDLHIGGFISTGALNIEDQAVVSVGRDTWVGDGSATGVINFTGGTLTTRHLYASPIELTGTGTINTNTILSDIDLVFDQSHGLQQQYILNTELGQNITVNIDASDTSANRAMGAGYRGMGTLTIADGISLTSSEGILGYSMGSQGSATVTGAGSLWDINESLFVGHDGTGTLNIESNAVVNVTLDTIVGQGNAASGIINLDGGTLNTFGLLAGTEDLKGTGTINTQGIVSDIDLVFDSTHGLQQQVILNGGLDQNITINLDYLDTTTNRALGAGHSGNGSLAILDGISVSSTQGILGYRSGSIGTATVSGIGSQWISNGDLMIGDKGTGTLNIENGGTVNSHDADIGYMSGSNGAVTVSGSESQWITDGDLNVGYQGDGVLNVLDGSFVQNDNTYLGYSSGSNATATVSGENSLWRIKYQFTVGRAGTGELIVQDGGQMHVDYYTPYQQTSEIGKEVGANGTVTVTDDGSHLDYRTILNIGNEGTGILNILNGGKVTSNATHLGAQTGAEGTASVTGVGSRWESSSSLFIGSEGTGTLNILNGGVVSTTSPSSYPDIIGDKYGSVGVVTVDGSGSQWNIDGVLYIANEGSGTLNLENNGAVAVGDATFIGVESSSNGMINFNNGTLNTLNLFASSMDILGTGTINAQGVVSDIDVRFDQASGFTPQVMINSLANQNITLNLDTTDTSVNNTLGAGFRGFGSLSITEGVSVSSEQGMLGYHSGSQGTATVTGTDSQWIIRDELIVGHEGLGTLNIRDGGFVQSDDDDVYIGKEVGAFGRVNLYGADTSWETHDLYIGRQGSGTLNIRDGATINSYRPYFGYEPGSYGMATITGTGSSWDASSLHVGWDGTGMLVIEQGAVATASLYLGHNSGSYGEATVTGASSILPRSVSTYYPDLSVGIAGTGVLNIEQGSLVQSASLDIGTRVGGIGIVNITDPNSRLDIKGTSYIGEEGSGTLSILNGGSVYQLYETHQASIGYEAGSIGRVNVSGVGSQWVISGHLTVGNLGDGRLYIEDQGTVKVGLDTWVRKDPAATGSINFNNGTLNTSGLIASATELSGTGTINTGTIVSDVDLVFDQYSGLQQQITLNTLPDQSITLNINPGSDPASNRAMGLGYRGIGSMTLADGLSLETTEGILGYYPGSTGTATITGAGTQWISSGDLTAGKGGDGTLVIEDGAFVQNYQGHIGMESGASGSVLVTGLGSVWQNTSYLYVGEAGPGSLVIENGGQVSNTYAGIGYGSEANSNSALVTGSGSQWNTHRLVVGHQGDSELRVENGGSINSLEITINALPGATAMATVMGMDSTWTSSDSLSVATQEGGTGTLNITDGGKVVIDYNYDTSATIGDGLESSGTVNVTGQDSALDIKANLWVGFEGDGTLNIEDHASVNVDYHTLVGFHYDYFTPAPSTSSGRINFNNGTLNTTILEAAPAELLGTGTINTNVIISDIDLRFDQALGLQQQITLDSEPDQNISMSIDYSDPSSNHVVGAGYRYDGSITIAEGLSITSTDGQLGFHTGSNGSAYVSGAGSQWLINEELKIGEHGNGSLSITDGGLVQSDTTYLSYRVWSSGSIHIAGAGSQLVTDVLTMGFWHDTSGSLLVENGGVLTSRTSSLGSGDDEQFEVTVTGPGSHWDNTEGISVGSTKLTIKDGGVVSIGGGASIAAEQYTTGQVMVTGPGAQWLIADDLTVRGNTEDVLQILDGAVVQSQDVYMRSFSSDKHVSATLDGADSRWIIDAGLYVGASGQAKITIQNDALLETHTLYLAQSGRSKGFINHDGGTVRLTGGDLHLAYGSRSEATYNLDGGTLDLQGGSILAGAGDVVQFNFNGGTVKQANTISLGQVFVQDGGTLAPGGSIGSTIITGEYQLNAGSIAIELGGLTPSTKHDQVSVTGALNLGLSSVLDVSMINAFAPKDGDSFDILDFGTITGSFGTIHLPVLGGNLYWNTSNLLVDGTLSVFSTLAGDLNSDGFVGIEDLNIVLGAWNQNVPPGDPLADPSGDGFVGIEDLNVVLGNWNAGTPPNDSANIPEPGTLILSGILLPAILMRRQVIRSA